MSLRHSPPHHLDDDSCSPLSDGGSTRCDDGDADGGTADGKGGGEGEPGDDDKKSDSAAELAGLRKAMASQQATIDAILAKVGDPTNEKKDEDVDKGGAGEAKDGELDQLKRMEQKLQEQDARLRAAAKRSRSDYLKSIGLAEGYEDVVPDFDPFSDDGRRLAAKWLEQHPKLKAEVTASADPDAARLRSLEEIMKEKPGAKFININEWDSARRKAAAIRR